MKSVLHALVWLAVVGVMLFGFYLRDCHGSDFTNLFEPMPSGISVIGQTHCGFGYQAWRFKSDNMWRIVVFTDKGLYYVNVAFADSDSACMAIWSE